MRAAYTCLQKDGQPSFIHKRIVFLPVTFRLQPLSSQLGSPIRSNKHLARNNLDLNATHTDIHCQESIEFSTYIHICSRLGLVIFYVYTTASRDCSITSIPVLARPLPLIGGPAPAEATPKKLSALDPESLTKKLHHRHKEDTNIILPLVYLVIPHNVFTNYNIRDTLAPNLACFNHQAAEDVHHADILPGPQG